MVKFIFSTIFSTCKNNAVVPSLHVLYQSFFPHKYQLGAQILDLSIVFMAANKSALISAGPHKCRSSMQTGSYDMIIFK